MHNAIGFKNCFQFVGKLAKKTFWESETFAYKVVL